MSASRANPRNRLSCCEIQPNARLISSCKMVVRTELEKLNLHPVNIALGEVAIEEKQLSKEQSKQLNDALKVVGFELIDDHKSKLTCFQLIYNRQ